jgi:hypothetical protein
VIVPFIPPAIRVPWEPLRALVNPASTVPGHAS